MKNYLVLFVAWFLAVLLWRWNVPPAFYMPLVPELVLLGLMFLLLPSPKQLLEKFKHLPLGLKISATLFAFLLVVSLVRGFYEWISISRTHPLCLSMPGVVQRLECLFGAAADQNYAPRTMLTLFTGSFGFFIMVVTQERTRKMILRALQLGGVSFAVASYLAHFGFINIPAGFYDSPFQYRFCYFIGNPSWMAPFLAPSLLASLVFIIEDRRWQILNILAVVPMLDVILRSQQRGGLIVVLLVAVFLVVFFSRRFIQRILMPLKKYRKSLTIGLVAVAGLLLFAMPFIWQLTTKALQTLGFGDRLSSSGFVSGERLIIWKAAWGELQGKLLFGHGYASWYRSGATQVPRYGLHQYFDTAHNFFVQFLFEHGILALSMWLIAAVLLVLGRWRRQGPTIQWITAAITALFLPIMLTQEVDFLRSGFYLTMASVGCALAVDSVPNDDQLSVSQPGWWLYFRSLMAIVLAVFGVLCFSAFSTGGYQYEANAVYGYGPRVRWFRQNGDINFVSSKAKSRGQFALYPVQSLNAKTMTLTSHDRGDTYKIDFSDVKPSQLDFVPVAARSMLSRSDTYSLDSAQTVDGRQLGILLNWPPILSAMPVIKTVGAQPGIFQPSADAVAEQGFLCSAACEIHFLPCRAGSSRKIYAVSRSGATIDAAEFSSDMAGAKDLKVDGTVKELPIPINHFLKLKITQSKTGDDVHPIFISGGACI